MTGAKIITVEQAVFAHDKIVVATGGLEGIRNLSLLESALSRPIASFAGKDLYPDIFAKTAALVHSLILNHPFLDGNKRTATFLGYRFLLINGYKFYARSKELVRFALDVEAKKFDQKEIARWLKNHSKKL